MSIEQKDWIGNKKSIFSTLGASNHSGYERAENDYYATDPNSLRLFLKALKRDGIELHKDIWECACGGGHLSEVLKENGYNVRSTDLVNRGYGEQLDFLSTIPYYQTDILTNPPYKYAKEFVEHALHVIEDDYYVVMLLRIQFLESRTRRSLFDNNPPIYIYIYIYSDRQNCYRNGEMSEKKSSAICYAWFVWKKNYEGETVVRWI